jgi:hypothetical protein
VRFNEMDGNRFDRLTKALSGCATRRAVIRTAGATVAPRFLALRAAVTAEACHQIVCPPGLEFVEDRCCPVLNGSCANGVGCCPNLGLECCNAASGDQIIKVCGDPRTIAFAYDPINCGACGVVCEEGECRNGVCVRCDSVVADNGVPLAYCRPADEALGNCRNTQVDAESCGGCFVSCGGGQCLNGTCV